MMTTLTAQASLAATSLSAATEGASIPIAQPAEGLGWAGLILLLPIISTLVCGLLWALRVKNKLPAWTTVLLLGGSFVVTLVLYWGYESPVVIPLLDWFAIDAGQGTLAASFSL